VITGTSTLEAADTGIAGAVDTEGGAESRPASNVAGTSTLVATTTTATLAEDTSTDRSHPEAADTGIAGVAGTEGSAESRPASTAAALSASADVASVTAKTTTAIMPKGAACR
jgi:hypothetical protein